MKITNVFYGCIKSLQCKELSRKPHSKQASHTQAEVRLSEAALSSAASKREVLEHPVLETPVLGWVPAALLSAARGLLLPAACDAAEHAWGALASCPLCGSFTARLPSS